MEKHLTAIVHKALSALSNTLKEHECFFVSLISSTQMKIGQERVGNQEIFLIDRYKE